MPTLEVIQLGTRYTLRKLFELEELHSVVVKQLQEQDEPYRAARGHAYQRGGGGHCQVVEAEARIRRVGTPLRSYWRCQINVPLPRCHLV